MFVEATPGDQLLKLIKQVEEKYKISEDHRIKKVTKTGAKLCNILERKNLFQKNCDEGCPPCASSEPGKPTKCQENNICYESKCLTCDSRGKTRAYTGEIYISDLRNI